MNANLQPGQLFQTADGRIFTLATPALSTTPQQDQDAQVVEARVGTDREEDTEEVSEEATTMEPVVTEAPVPREAPISKPVIATAPFTPSTARFVSAVPANFLSSPVTHITHSSPTLLTQGPSTAITRGHSLADSSVVTGYFSFPSAGLNFDF